MTYIRNLGAEPRNPVRGRRAAGAVMMAMTAMMAAMVGLSALADPPAHATFAHKYKASYVNTIARASFALMLEAPLFEPLVETRVSEVPGSVQQEVPGGIHQGKKAQTVGGAVGLPVRFEYRPNEAPDNRIILQVGDQAIYTKLLASQAGPMASLVDRRNNGLISLNEAEIRDGKEVYRPKVAESYIDTEEGYWLLWADAIAGDLFDRLKPTVRAAVDGLTIVDAEDPVTIDTDGGLKVVEGEPRVAFWMRLGGEKGHVLGYIDLKDAIGSLHPDDVQALKAVRRVFKWAPVMRLAAESDPIAFGNFARQLQKVRITPVATPRELTKL
jgi:hypothetical protein